MKCPDIMMRIFWDVPYYYDDKIAAEYDLILVLLNLALRSMVSSSVVI